MWGYTEVGFVHVVLNVFQPLRYQFRQILLPPQNNLRPRLQVQDAEVGLPPTEKQRQLQSKTFKLELVGTVNIFIYIVIIEEFESLETCEKHELTSPNYKSIKGLRWQRVYKPQTIWHETGAVSL